MALTSWLYEASFGLEVGLCTLNAQPYDQPPPSYGDAIKDLPPDYSALSLLAIQETMCGDCTPPIGTKDPRVRSKSPRIDLDRLFGLREHKGPGKKKTAKQAAQQSTPPPNDDGDKSPPPDENQNGGDGGSNAGGSRDGNGDNGGDGGGGDGGDDDGWGDTWNITSKKKDKRKKEEEEQLAKEEEEQKAKEEEEKKAAEEAAANASNNDLSWANNGSGNGNDSWAGFVPAGKKKNKKKDQGATLIDTDPPSNSFQDINLGGNASPPNLSLGPLGGKSTGGGLDLGGWGKSSNAGSKWGLDSLGGMNGEKAQNTNPWSFGSADPLNASVGFGFGFGVPPPSNGDVGTQENKDNWGFLDTKKKTEPEPEIADDDDWGWGVSTNKKDKKKKNGAILEELEPVVETHPVVASPTPKPVPEEKKEDDWAGWNISTQEKKKKKDKDAEPEPEPKTLAQAEPEPEPTPEAKLPDDPLYYNWVNFPSKDRKKREKPLMKKGLPIPGKEFAWPPPPPEPVADEPVQEPELEPESRPQAEPKPQPEPITLSLPDDPLYNDWDELSTKDKRKREKSLLKKGLPIPGKDFPWPPSPPEPLVEEPALEPEPEPEFEPEPVPEELEPQAEPEPEPEPESKALALPDDPLYNNWDNLFSKDREKRERTLIKKGLPIPGKDFEWPPQPAPVAEEPVQEPEPEVIPEPVIDESIPSGCTNDLEYHGYEGQTVTVLIGPRGRFYTISRSLLDKIPSLYSLLQTNPTREEHNTCKTITLSDVDERIGHTLMHYLYTGDFQVQKASSNSGTPKKQVYYAQSVLAYCTATKYSLSGLQDHAKGFMEAFGPSISIHDIVDLAREVYSKIGEDLWYLQHLTARIQAAFDADDRIFSEERFLNGFGEGSPLDKFLVRIMTQAFYTTIGSNLQNP